MIILSAHCDDVPLSLGGSLLGKLFKIQPNVIVIFSITNYIQGYNSSISQEEATLLRRKEELKAAKVANYMVKFLDFKDAVCRPNYSKYTSLFTNKPILKDPIYPLVKKVLIEILANKASLICSPLSIGNHVDHRIITNIVMDLLIDNPNLPVLFYEDLPYADYIPFLKIEEIINKLKNITHIRSFIFKNFDIKQKITLLKIYKSQIDSKQLKMVYHYWDSIGKGERIWLTESAHDLLKNTKII